MGKMLYLMFKKHNFERFKMTYDKKWKRKEKDRQNINEFSSELLN